MFKREKPTSKGHRLWKALLLDFSTVEVVEQRSDGCGLPKNSGIIGWQWRAMVVWPTPLVLAWPRAALCLAFLWHREDRRPNTHVPLYTTTANPWSSPSFFFFSFSFLFSLSLSLLNQHTHTHTHPVTLKKMQKEKHQTCQRERERNDQSLTQGRILQANIFENSHMHRSSRFRQRWKKKAAVQMVLACFLYPLSRSKGRRTRFGVADSTGRSTVAPAPSSVMAQWLTSHAVAKLRPKRHLFPKMKVHYHASEMSPPVSRWLSFWIGATKVSRFTSGRVALSFKLVMNLKYRYSS